MLNAINETGSSLHADVCQSKLHVDLAGVFSQVQSAKLRGSVAFFATAGTNAADGSRETGLRHNRKRNSGRGRGLRHNWRRYSGRGRGLRHSRRRDVRGGGLDARGGGLRHNGGGRGVTLGDRCSYADGDSDSNWGKDWIALWGWQASRGRGSEALRDLGPVQVVQIGYIRVATLGLLQLLVVLNAGAHTLILGVLALSQGLQTRGCSYVTGLTVGLTLRLVFGGLTRGSFNRGLLTANEKHFQNFKAGCAGQQGTAATRQPHGSHTKNASQRRKGRAGRWT